MEWSAMRSENPMLSDVDYVEKDLRFYFVESLDVLRDFFGSIAGNEEKRRPNYLSYISEFYCARNEIEEVKL